MFASLYTANLLPFDHIQPSPLSTLKSPTRTAILYVSTESNEFRALHSLLYAASSVPDPTIQYILRYVTPIRSNPSRNYLSGYGVALDLKKTDYLALDDRRAAVGSTDGDDLQTTKQEG